MHIKIQSAIGKLKGANEVLLQIDGPLEFLERRDTKNEVKLLFDEDYDHRDLQSLLLMVGNDLLVTLLDEDEDDFKMYLVDPAITSIKAFEDEDAYPCRWGNKKIILQYTRIQNDKP